ncbi:hypothetical protein Poli38472_011193 [Pythium oligandrum]|uniref:Uncharacterized protein n=1 Tax=Pythium oligandrum TaxID=41045 RepID=A0A8K1FRH1_PYTOL|nr:hypothetical protein Poli38472_011193 [Pythium oligandrum]|eukprot:TMW67573.1 hypothetical protein Poli38472_011193 [Pythium oligandrum]
MAEAVRPLGVTEANGDVSERSEDDSEPQLDIRAGPWAFLSKPYSHWLFRVRYADAPLEESQSQRFSHYDFFLPWAINDSDLHRATLRECREALELIGLMLRVDPSTWLYALNEPQPWSARFNPLVYDQWELIPRMELRMHRPFGRYDEHDGSLKQCRYFMVDCDRSERGNAALSPSFFEMREWILAMDKSKVLVGFKIPLRIHFQPPEFEETEQLASYFQDASDLIQGIKTRQEEPSGAYPFVLESASIDLHPQFLNDSLDGLRQLLSLGVPFSIKCEDLASVEDPVQNSRFMTLFSRYPGLSNWCNHRLEVANYETAALIAMSSALVSSNCLRELVIDECIDDEDSPQTQLACARWLSYACFSKASQNTVLSLTLNKFRMSEECLEAAREIISSEDPVTLLRVEGDTLVSGRRLVTVNEDAFIQCPQGGDEWYSPSDLQIPVSTSFRMIGRNMDTLQIIVPGLGPCSVKCTDTHDADEDTAKIEPSRITSLAITRTEDDTQAPAFVQLVGMSLRVLQLNSSEGDLIEDDDIQDILSACPDLETLVIDGASWKTMDPILDYCVRSSSLCHLSSLSLWNVELPSSEGVRFFEVLANTASPLGQNLQELVLALSFTDEDIPGLDLKSARKCVKMLLINTTLSYVRIKLQYEALEELGSEFEALHGQPTAKKLERLQLDRKLAFLSVVQHQQCTTQAIGQLDSRCVSQIFEYFGFYRPRRVFFETW